MKIKSLGGFSISKEREGSKLESLHSNTLTVENKYLTENPKPMENLPEKLKELEIPYFRQKPVMLLFNGFNLFFKEINKSEYWI